MRNVSTRPEKLAWIASFLGLFFLVSGSILAQTAHSTALIAACVASTVLLIVSLVSGGRLRFSRRQAEEEEGMETYRREHEGSELFEDTDEAVQLAARANEQYTKFFVPFVTAAVGLGILLAGVFFWISWNKALVLPLAPQPLRSSVLSFSLFLAGVIAGSYYIGVSREPGCRWVRPCGAWMFFTALLFMVGGLALIGEHFGTAGEQLDVRAAKIATAVLMLLGAELVIKFVIEFYRPRTLGEEERPLYESRLLGLFTEPGGVARNVATSLDYQFGFQVSEVWFYRFLERTVTPFAVVMVIGLWLQTCVVVVRTEENGIRERLGRVVSETPLQPGIYAKLPTPFARIHKFPVERVQEIPVGYTPADADADDHASPNLSAELQGDYTGRVIVWSKQHHKEELDFIVASAPDAVGGGPEGDTEAPGELPVSVYFMTAGIPLYFKVSNLYDYAYRHQDALKTLTAIATREVVSYLANVDFFAIITSDRAKSGDILRQRIQDSANDLQLGIDVVFVGLQGLHPPVKVGRTFDEVVAAMEQGHEDILNAEAEATRSVLAAEAAAVRRTTDAAAYRQHQIQVSEAEAERFKKQMLAYDASPALFVLRSYLDVLENEAAETRKYVVAAQNGGDEVIVINLEPKLGSKLTDLYLGEDEGEAASGE